MVINARRRRILILLAFHASAWSMTGYFAHAAYSGDRGILAKREHKIRAFGLTREIAELKVEKGAWTRRVDQLKAAEIDLDLLEERVRLVLNGAQRTELVINLPLD